MDSLSFLAGLAMILAFAPFGYWYLIFLSLGSLLWVWTKTNSPLRTGWRGLLFGIGIYGVGLYWFINVSETFSSQYEIVIQLIIYSVYLILSFYPAILGVILFFIKKHLSLTWMIGLFPILWVIFESIRSWLFTGLSLYQPSYAFIDTSFSGFAPLGGELLTNLMILICVSSFIFFILHRTKFSFASFIMVSAIIWGAGTYANTISWGDVTRVVHTRVIHGTPDSRIKTRHYYILDTIDKYLKYSQKLPRPDLVIWPESSIATEFRSVKRQLTPQAHILNQLGTDILLGAYMTKKHQEYNVVLQASNPDNFYAKKHLIPFGEYMPDTPFIELDKYVPRVEMGTLASSNLKQKTLQVQNLSIATAICYEIIFGTEFRESWKDADILLLVSDLNWFQNTWAAEQLLQIARFRAKESEKPLLSSTSFGVTAIVDARGKVISSYKSLDKSSYIDGKIEIFDNQTPYAKFGIWVVTWVSLSYLLLLFFYTRLVMPASTITTIRDK